MTEESKKLFSALPARNNTSFSYELHRIMEQLPLLYENDHLKPHQRKAHDYFMYYPLSRGLLAYHNLGAGKSILAVAIAESSIEEGRNIVFLSIRSLHENLKNNIRKYYENLLQKKIDVEAHIAKNYVFITLNASNMVDQIEKINDIGLGIEKTARNFMNPLDDKTVIVDEAHEVFNSITNGSKNGTALYTLLMTAKNVKILFLSGTPIINSPFEITIAFNMLSGKLLFSEDYMDFQRKWINNPEVDDPDQVSSKIFSIKNANKFMNRITGLVSYYNISEEEQKANFPKQYPEVVVDCPMSEYQYSNYAIAREKEIAENLRNFGAQVRAPLLRAGTKKISTYRVFSRQVSNFMYPPEISFFGRREGKFTYEKQKLTPKMVTPEELHKYSGKLTTMLKLIANHLPKGMLDAYRVKMRDISNIPVSKILKEEVGPGLVYTQFLDSGVVPLTNALLATGMSEFNIDSYEVNSNGSFAVISGEVPPEIRNAVLGKFNSKENENAQIIALLIYTSTGAQGLDTKRVRHTHAMEPYWNRVRILQHYGRAFRYQAHIDLPPNKRTIRNYIYRSTYPTTQNDKDKNKELMMNLKNTELTTDVTLYKNSLLTNYMNRSFLTPMQRVSIDCVVDCRVCKPNGKKLFAEDLDEDIKLPDTCTPLSNEELRVESLIIGDVVYYYSKSGTQMRVFIEIEPGVFKELPQTSSEYGFVLSQI